MKSTHPHNTAKRIAAFLLSACMVTGSIPAQAVAEPEADTPPAQAEAESPDTPTEPDDLELGDPSEPEPETDSEPSPTTESDPESPEPETSSDAETPTTPINPEDETDEKAHTLTTQSDSRTTGYVDGDLLNGITVRIHPENSHYSLCLAGDGYGEKAVVHLYNIGDSNRFYFEKADSESYYIRYYNEPSSQSPSVYVLDVDSDLIGGYNKENAPIHSIVKDNGNHQRWKVYRYSDGTYAIQNKQTEKWWALNDRNDKTDNGNRLVQNSSRMFWELEVVSASSPSKFLSAMTYSTYTFYQGDDEVNSTNWMSHLPGNLFVSELSIPGVHDAGTCDLKPLSIDAKCQQMYIDDLLNAGVRYFDLRCSEDYTKNGKTSPRLNHTFDCVDKDGTTLTMEDVMGHVRDFMGGSGKNETLIFQISRQGDESDSLQTGKIYSYFKNLVHNHPDWFYYGDHMPTLSETRGKIVILSRLDRRLINNKSKYVGNVENAYIYGHEDDGSAYTGADAKFWAIDISAWSAHNDDFKTADSNVLIAEDRDYQVWVEDNYDSSADNKWPQVEKAFTGAFSRHISAVGGSTTRWPWIITYTSASSMGHFTGVTTPISAARNINQRLYSHDQLSKGKGTFTGVLAMDFVDEQLCWRIWLLNYNYQWLDKMTVSPTSAAYTGSAVMPSSTTVTTNIGNTLSDTQKKLTCTNNVNVGTATATVVSPNFMGKVSADYTIGNQTFYTSANVGDTGLAFPNLNNEFAKGLLTEDELQAVTEGAECHVWIEAKLLDAKDVPEADKKLIDERAAKLGYEVGRYLDVSLYKQIGDAAPVKVTSLDRSKLKAVWTVAQSMRKSGRSFGVLHAHGGEVLEYAVGKQDTELSWDNGGLSTFAYVYKDTEGTATNTNSTPAARTTSSTTLPKTGDDSSMAMVAMVAAIGAVLLGSWFAVRRKKRDE